MRYRTLIMIIAAVLLLQGQSRTNLTGSEDSNNLRRENFDKNPEWDGHNNRLAGELPPETIKQDFGYSPDTAHAGGAAGEIGGVIQPAAEAAYYARQISPRTLNDSMSASGKLFVAKGGGNLLFGFFNGETLNEWRTPNSLVFRINARGDIFHAHVEFATQKWRANAGIIGKYDSVTDRNHPIELPCDAVYEWSLKYDAAANDGNGAIEFILAGERGVINLKPGQREDGATFNRFGLLNIIKSYDGAGTVWLDDVSIDDELQDFSRDPQWDGLRNREEYPTSGVRPRFDFGYSPTQHAGGEGSGELGGTIYRGDCREANKLACYGDELTTLTLDKPLHASGKVTLRRGVSDSTALLGFYHSVHSVAVSDSQRSETPRDFLGIAIGGPSAEGFYIYPVACSHDGEAAVAEIRDSPRILPDGGVHEWSLDYDPKAANGNGRVTVTLDKQTVALDFPEGEKTDAFFDRFGIVSTWVDGNAQEVFLDDLRYTCR